MGIEPSKWVVGYTVFAGVVLCVAGAFHAIAGLGGIFDDQAYDDVPNWALQFDPATWGWILFIGGLLVILAGVSVMRGHVYGRVIGTIAAVVSATVNFAWLPYKGLWGALIIALDLCVIWALTIHGQDIVGEE